jgi:hypothetical protein
VFIDLRGSDDQQALFAVAGDYNLAIFAAFQRAFERIEAQSGFGPVLAMAANTRFLEHGPDVFGERDTRLIGRGR